MERLGNNKTKQQPKMNVKNMLGIKLFKENEDTIELYRIIKIVGDKIKVKNEADGSVSVNTVEDFEGFSPLSADGYLTCNVVTIGNKSTGLEKDVVVTVNKILDMEYGNTFPFAICRQSITDVFHNLTCRDESEQIVGLSVNQNDCPTNFDIGIMLACNNIEYSEHCSFYREDTLEDILKMINTKRFDLVLSNLYVGHCKAIKDPAALMKKECGGWCKDLKTLLNENTFQSDINEMLGITDLTFNVEDYLEKATLPNGVKYDTARGDFKIWLAGTFRININTITILEYNHDINLAVFNESLYFFIRGANKRLWICLYTIDGQYLESDLEEQYNALDVSDKYRLKFYNKYDKK